MPGGTFTPGVEKTRPGFYVNFENVGPTKVSLSERGTLALVIPNPTFGPLKKFITIHNTELEGKFSELGYKMIEPAMLLIREAFKRAKTVHVYLAGNGGNKATGNVGGASFTAKYEGTRGNDFRVVIQDSVVSKKKVAIFLETQLVFEIDEVEDVSELPTNPWIDFGGSGSLVNSAGMTLSGGTNATTANVDVTDFLEDVEILDFNAIAFPVTDAPLISAFDTKIKYFNNDIGKYCQGFRAKESVPADSEFITTLNNGVELADGTMLSAAQASVWYGAASASASITTDLTYVAYDGAIDANPRRNHSETISALKSGEVVFTASREKVIVEEDINSLTSFTATRDEAYSDNRFIRTLAEIALTGRRVLPPNKYDNDDDGQSLAKRDLVAVLLLMQSLHALKNVDVDNDVVIDKQRSKGKSFFADVFCQPVRTYKKYYITVKTS